MTPWGPYRPDAATPNSPYCSVADGVIPKVVGVGQYGNQVIGYGPFPQLVTVATAGALSGAPKGALALIDASGAGDVFVATATTIAQLQADYTFSAIESGRTDVGSDDVSFCKFGAFLLNSDATNGFKAYNFDTPAGNNAVAGAPAARYLFACNNVVFALSCGGNVLKMQSSGLGDHTAWVLKGANGKIFEDGGGLQAGVDLKNGAGLIFQSEAMRLIQFGDAPDGALYSIKKVADGRGSVGERSVVAFDGMAFYLAPDGFYKFDLQNGNTPIGAEKWNAWFLNQIAATDLVTVQGAIDPQRKLVMWRYRSIQCSSSTVFDKIFVYDWHLNEGTTLTVQTSWLLRYKTPGYTLDGIDAFGALDSFTTLLDDPFWTGGISVFGALDSVYKFATFSGTPMAATLTGPVSNSPTTGLLQWATPIDDDPTSMLAVGTSDRLDAAIAFQAAQSKGENGAVPLDARGMNMQFTQTFAAGDTWTFASGIDNVKASAGGPR